MGLERQLMCFDLASENNDFYLKSARIMNFMHVLELLKIVDIRSAFHAEGQLYVVIKQ